MILYYCDRCKKMLGAYHDRALVTDYNAEYDSPAIEAHFENNIEDRRKLRSNEVILCDECAQDFGVLISTFFRGAKITVTEDEGKDKEKNE